MLILSYPGFCRPMQMGLRIRGYYWVVLQAGLLDFKYSKIRNSKSIIQTLRRRDKDFINRKEGKVCLPDARDLRPAAYLAFTGRLFEGPKFLRPTEGSPALAEKKFWFQCNLET
jgi:hypothetical protein